MRRGGASSGASRTKRRDVGMLTVAIALRIGGMRSCSVRSCSGRTKRALKILSVWVSSWCVYVGFVPAKTPPAPMIARTRVG
jgi:hypothetical protein